MWPFIDKLTCPVLNGTPLSYELDIHVFVLENFLFSLVVSLGLASDKI